MVLYRKNRILLVDKAFHCIVVKVHVSNIAFRRHALRIDGKVVVLGSYFHMTVFESAHRDGWLRGVRKSV